MESFRRMRIAPVRKFRTWPGSRICALAGTDGAMAERWLLEAVDGNAPLQEIASEAAERFPNVFRRQEEAFRRASELAEKFSR